jgi:hypothetical protein
MDQLRADTFLDLLEGVGIGSSPVHRSGVVELTVPWTTATGATNDPGLLAGFGPIDANTARDIISGTVARLATASRDAAGTRWRHTLSDDSGRLLSTTGRSKVEHARRPPGRALGGVTGVKSFPTPGPVAPVQEDPTQRAPGAELARWITTRDRTCRAPGCRVPARAADIDHTNNYSTGGPTSHDNLAVVCRHHHRLKHDGGWRVTQPEPGTLIWTSPRGRDYVRRPDPP